MSAGTLTDVPGILVGHYTDPIGVTGCTVILHKGGMTAAADLRGAAPATHETDLLRVENTVQRVQALLLTGGSAFGLAATSGVMRYLEQRGLGFPTRAGPVPIVPAAAIYDLTIGDAGVRPGPDAGYDACQAATAEAVPQGSVGAGTGATVGHLRGSGRRVKAGLGSASRRLHAGTIVGALVIVNAFGDVLEPGTQRILAGTLADDGEFLGTTDCIEEVAHRRVAVGQNTTLGVVATDAMLNRAELLRVAQMAHDGLARVISPVHTGFDGDIVFACSTSARPAIDSTIVGTVAAEILAAAVVNAILHATRLAGVPSAGETRSR